MYLLEGSVDRVVRLPMWKMGVVRRVLEECVHKLVVWNDLESPHRFVVAMSLLVAIRTKDDTLAHPPRQHTVMVDASGSVTRRKNKQEQEDNGRYRLVAGRRRCAHKVKRVEKCRFLSLFESYA